MEWDVPPGEIRRRVDRSPCRGLIPRNFGVLRRPAEPAGLLGSPVTARSFRRSSSTVWGRRKAVSTATPTSALSARMLTRAGRCLTPETESNRGRPQPLDSPARPGETSNDEVRRVTAQGSHSGGGRGTHLPSRRAAPCRRVRLGAVTTPCSVAGIFGSFGICRARRRPSNSGSGERDGAEHRLRGRWRCCSCA